MAIRRMMMFGAVLGLPASANADVVVEQVPSPPVLPGSYSNEEQVYFAKEANQPAPPLIYLLVDEQTQTEAVDAFGMPSHKILDGMTITSGNAERFTARLPDGKVAEMRRARPATCWVAIKKNKPKADGSPDWFFAQGVRLHDQGGRAMVGEGVADMQPVMIRMRNVVWPPKADGTPSSNKPSIVLYVHKPDQYDRSEAYVWGDPGAARIGINLRWMQASCGIDGMEQPSAVTATSFRG